MWFHLLICHLDNYKQNYRVFTSLVSETTGHRIGISFETRQNFRQNPTKQGTHHRIDKRKSFVFTRQYRNCFSRRTNGMVPRNQLIKTAIGMVMHNFHGL